MSWEVKSHPFPLTLHVGWALTQCSATLAACDTCIHAMVKYDQSFLPHFSFSELRTLSENHAVLLWNISLSSRFSILLLINQK